MPSASSNFHVCLVKYGILELNRTIRQIVNNKQFRVRSSIRLESQPQQMRSVIPIQYFHFPSTKRFVWSLSTTYRGTEIVERICWIFRIVVLEFVNASALLTARQLISPQLNRSPIPFPVGRFTVFCVSSLVLCAGVGLHRRRRLQPTRTIRSMCFTMKRKLIRSLLLDSNTAASTRRINGDCVSAWTKYKCESGMEWRIMKSSPMLVPSVHKYVRWMVICETHDRNGNTQRHRECEWMDECATDTYSSHTAECVALRIYKFGREWNKKRNERPRQRRKQQQRQDTPETNFERSDAFLLLFHFALTGTLSLWIHFCPVSAHTQNAHAHSHGFAKWTTRFFGAKFAVRLVRGGLSRTMLQETQWHTHVPHSVDTTKNTTTIQDKIIIKIWTIFSISIPVMYK